MGVPGEELASLGRREGSRPPFELWYLCLSSSSATLPIPCAVIMCAHVFPPATPQP